MNNESNNIPDKKNFKDRIISEQTSRKEKKFKSKQNQIAKHARKRQNAHTNRKNVRRLNEYLKDKQKFAPHPLIVIHDETYQKVKNNAIILANMNRKDVTNKNCSDGGITNFSVKSYGNNLSHLFDNSKHHHNSFHYNIHNSMLPDNYLILLCDANEKCLLEDPNTTFIPTEIKSDDYVLLMIYVSTNSTEAELRHIPIWDNIKDLSSLRKVKKSTVKSNKPNHHYGSTGECYSFGVRSAFSSNPCNNITIGKYAGDEYQTMEKYKNYVWNNFDLAFNSFDNIVSCLSNNLNITCRSMDYQSRKTELTSYLNTDCNELNIAGPRFILSGNININATTRDIHCEKDITYTTIHVPRQKESNASIVFQFQLNELFSLNIQVLPNCSFTYSAYCLAHRQLNTNGLNCMNLSTYATRRLYNNYRKSLQRLTEN